jgi:pyridoxal phosphate enzyme (YggS family)
MEQDHRTTELQENLEALREDMAEAEKRSGREPGSARLVAVSKLHPAEDVARLLGLGQRVFGESYVQEAVAKQEELAGLDAEWHFIGGLQTNKARFVGGRFALVHSVDSSKLARLLHKHAQDRSTVQRALIQVSLAGEIQKSGIVEDELPSLVEECMDLPGLDLVGFMTMPPFFDDPEAARPYFRRLREVRDEMEQRFGARFPELSMGMTGDFAAAIEEGATLVRVGTRLLGARCKYQP